MIPVYRSFYGKLSAIFLVLILALGGVSLIIAFNAAELLFDEVEQLLNREYAASIALELRPLVQEGFSEAGIKDAIHYMMVLNPMVEIYLLDNSGAILAYFTHPEEQVTRFTVDLDPIKEFVANEGRGPVLGDDPRTADRQKPFSAAPLRMGREQGYVYVILRGQGFDRSLEMLRSSYFLRTGLSTFLLAILATLLAGLSLFSLLTRRLRRLSSAVRAFELGDFKQRIEAGGSDELGALGKAFNDMAGSIESGVEKLRESERQRSDLIANISHDLRSPLTSIRGNLETLLVKEVELTGPEGREFLNTTLRNVSRFQDLVEDLFELAKLEAGQVSPKKEDTQLAELVQDVALKIRPRAETTGVSLSFSPTEGLPTTEIDIGMIERVITNIVENAIIHTPEGGTVAISMALNGDDVAVEVTDTGSGIDEADLPYVFERFYRGDKSRDRSSPGTGLGLAIARELVVLHGGRIEAANTPASGARVTFLLPASY